MPETMTREEAQRLYDKPISELSVEERCLLPAVVRVLFPTPEPIREADALVR